MVCPMPPKGAKIKPESSILGAQKVTFSGKVAESGPVREPQYLLWFKHIQAVPGRPGGHRKSSLERRCHTDLIFSRLFAIQGRPGSAPGPNREPNGAPKAPQGHPESIQNLSKIVSGRPGGAEGTPGVPTPLKKDPKIDERQKRMQKAIPKSEIREHFVLYFR